MPLNAWNEDSPLIQDQGAMGVLADEPPPLFYDEQYQPSAQRLQSMQAAPQPQGRLQQQAQAQPQQQENDYSGNVEPPSRMDLLPGIFGGKAGVEFKYQQLMNKKAAPVMSKLMQAGNKALLEGDEETVNQVVTGMSTLAGTFPQYGKQIEAFTNKVITKQNNVQGNSALIEYVGKTLGNSDPETVNKIAALNAIKTRVSPTDTMKLIEKFYPQIKQDQNYVVLTDQITGESKIKTLPTMSSVKDMTPEENQAFALGQFPIAKEKYIDLKNKAQAGEKMTYEDFKTLDQIQGAMQGSNGQPGLVGKAIGFNRLPAQDRINNNMPTELANQVAGIAPQGQQKPPGTLPMPQQGKAPQGQPGAQQQAQMPQPGLKPGNYGKAQQQFMLTVEEAKTFPEFANLNDDQIKQALADPRIASEFTNRFMSGLSETQQAARLQRMHKALTAGDVEAATLQSKLKGEPLNQMIDGFTMDTEGKVQRYQGPALTNDQARQKGIFLSTQPTYTQKLQDYAGISEQGHALFDKLKEAKPDDFSAFNRLVAKGINIPIKIPFVPVGGSFTVEGSGGVSMTRRQADLYNDLVSFAQNSEPFMNSLGKDNEYVKSVKAEMTGNFATRDSSLVAVKSILEQGFNNIKGVMKTAPGAVPEDAKLKLDLPKFISQGGAKDTIKENAKGALGIESIKEQFHKDYENVKGDAIKLKELVSKTYNKLKESVTSKSTISSPINPETRRSLRRLTE